MLRCSLTYKVPGYLKVVFFKLKILSSLLDCLWGLKCNTNIRPNCTPICLFIHIYQEHSIASYLPVDPEGTTLLLQFNSCDTCHLPSLLDVGTMRADGKAHQVLPDLNLLLVR